MPTDTPLGTVAAVVPDSSCQIHISRDVEHPDWDAFLMRTPGRSEHSDLSSRRFPAARGFALSVLGFQFFIGGSRP